MKNVNLICDLQYGSTGKGLIAGYLAERDGPDVIATAWSMNAGHTYINRAGRKFVHCMLANGVVSPNLTHILIGPGSQIGILKLHEELNECADLLTDVTIYVHEHACIIQDHHIELENLSMDGIGSTKKGCGAALAEKIGRQVDRQIVAKDFKSSLEDGADFRGVHLRVVGSKKYDEVVDHARLIHVEGAQGYSLGINSGFYPYVTSRECTPAQIMTDCAIPISRLRKVIGTMRTLPIRVAHRYNEGGEQIGHSGPCYVDQRELAWTDLGIEPELTTVTQLARRIFTFSRQQCWDAIRATTPDEIFLNFANYISDDEVKELVRVINGMAGDGRVTYIGYGPTPDKIKEVR